MKNLKNLGIIFLTVLAAFSVSMAVSAEQKNVGVTATVPEESYIVTIPDSPLYLSSGNAEMTPTVSNVKLFKGSYLSVSVESANDFQLVAGDINSDSFSTIGYTMYYDKQTPDGGTRTVYLEQGSEIFAFFGEGTGDDVVPQSGEIKLHLELEKDGINNATMAGEHTDTLTFTYQVSSLEVVE